MFANEKKSQRSIRKRGSVEFTKEEEVLSSSLAGNNSSHNRSFQALRSLLDQVAQNKTDTTKVLPEIIEKTRQSSLSNPAKASPARSYMRRRSSGGIIKKSKYSSQLKVAHTNSNVEVRVVI